MPQHQARPFEDQQPAAHHEHNERQVQQHQAIGGDSIEHVDPLARQSNRCMVLGRLPGVLSIVAAQRAEHLF
ncbi:hypothetical protein D3C80_2166510 [compost metagenome]